MLAQLPPEIAGLFGAKTVAYATAAYVAAQSLGRVYQAIRVGGGLVSIWRGLMFGTNVPTEKQQETTSPKP